MSERSETESERDLETVDVVSGPAPSPPPSSLSTNALGASEGVVEGEGGLEGGQEGGGGKLEGGVEDRHYGSPAPHQILLASAYLSDAINGNHMHFEPTVSAVHLYGKFKSVWMTCLLYTVLLLYLCLVLVEEPAVPGIAVPFFITVGIELFCLTFFLFRLAHEYLFSKKDFFWRDEKHIMVLLIVIVSVVDICIYTGLVESSIATIRIARVFRPLILVNIPEGRQIRRAFRNIRRTLPEIASVLVLFGLIVAVFALMAAKIFGKRGWVKVNGVPYFPNFLEAYWDLYVLVTTANNPDIMMPAYNQDPWLCLFFIVFIIICLYVFMSIFLAVVYNNYRSNLKNEVHDAIVRKRQLLDTVFDLMRSEVNGRQVIVQSDFNQLVKLTVPRKSDQYMKVIWFVLDADNNGYVDKKEFLTAADLLNIPVIEILPNLFDRYLPSLYTSRVSRKIKTLVKHKAFRYVFDAIIIINAFFILFDLDGYEFVFLAIFIMEILLKVYTFGCYMFIRKLWNVFDVVVIGSAFFISIVEEARHDKVDSGLILDVMMVLRVLRIVKIFHSFHRFKNILNTIMHILPSMVTYAGVLFVFFYFFAVIGLEAFKNKIQFFGADPSVLPPEQLYCGNLALENSEFYRQQYCANNFNNALSAFVLLFQLLVVNQWHVLAEGFELAVGSKYTRIYFISFHVLSVIIILNIFTAFVLEIFILEYSFSRGTLESTLEDKINEMGLGFGTRPSRPRDAAEAAIIEEDELGLDEQDADHDNLEFVSNQLDEMARNYNNYSKETPIRFHLRKGGVNVHTLLEKLFIKELDVHLQEETQQFDSKTEPNCDNTDSGASSEFV